MWFCRSGRERERADEGKTQQANQRRATVTRTHSLYCMKIDKDSLEQVVYVDVTWIHAAYTVSKCWHDPHMPGVLKNDMASQRWIIVHAGSAPGLELSSVTCEEGRRAVLENERCLEKQMEKIVIGLGGDYDCESVSSHDTDSSDSDSGVHGNVTDGNQHADEKTTFLIINLDKLPGCWENCETTGHISPPRLSGPHPAATTSPRKYLEGHPPGIPVTSPQELEIRSTTTKTEIMLKRVCHVFPIPGCCYEVNRTCNDGNGGRRPAAARQSNRVATDRLTAAPPEDIGPSDSGKWQRPATL
ncbi:hypothetical protein PR048_032941 [Dryococelus australis]|uniref:Uncharacterized protein n=1 Tax=Dryococelus australis TaxID=614101 RepID=A0ABQ9G3N2_9NEOP|nr:hypothetical protein PR048_032941 [Dryococelus australis]